VQFKDLNAQYPFGFAAFDNAQIRHAVQVSPRLDFKWCLVFRFEGGKIKVTNFCENQHRADIFFNTVYALKPLPDRLA
jgi:hypothetical protein